MRSICLLILTMTVSALAFSHDHPSIAGQPGDPGAVEQTIAISATDVKFSPTMLIVRSGETVKFVITNYGKLPHEFMIGDKAEQQEHEKEMQSMQGMGHADSNAVSIGPGETKVLVWKFGKDAVLEFGCHVPGHYAAGMLGTIHVVTPVTHH